MSDTHDQSLAVALMSEILAADQSMKAEIARHLPRGMELSHFSVLNHLNAGGEKSPAQLARNFHLTKGAMTNTLNKLETAGYVHVRPDWDDARKKLVSISPAGRRARDIALHQLQPVFDRLLKVLGPEQIRHTLPFLRAFRAALD